MTGSADGPIAGRQRSPERWFAEQHSAAVATEDPVDGATWLLDLVSAVDHLRRGHRHAFTVWDALEEALRAWVTVRRGEDGDPVRSAAGGDDLPWDAADPLASTLADVLDALAVEPHLDARAVFQQAVRRWVLDVAACSNDGALWPHPLPRRSFPPMRLSLLDETNLT